MKQRIKRNVALLMAFLMCISFIPVFHLEASATSVSTSNKVTYRYSGDYVYNWGEREEVATFLSPMAIAFYEEYGTSYEQLAKNLGGTTQSNAQNSALYKALKSLMVQAHDYETSYNATRPLYQYTDCENNGNVISSFYSGVTIGPDWDSGKTWNREHTWPNSKGMEGRDEDDIMMLRPTSVSENSSRGNKAYGKSSSYYNPNKESGGKHDLRGDVARIFLYVYVRWSNLNKAWGSDGVMESSAVLLEWMEADPVDTWELGRNDAVQSITGTRNVFVDYPEFAFLLFGKEIPSGWTTPSGEKNQSGSSEPQNPTTPPSVNTCNHSYDNDCDADCNACGESRAVSHIYDYYCDNSCNKCGETRNTDHLYSRWQVVKEASVDEAGIKRGVCIYCKQTTEIEIPKLAPPVVEEPVQPPTQTPVEPPIQEDPIVPPPSDECEHIFGDWEKTESGEKTRACTKCGEIETVPDDEIIEEEPPAPTGIAAFFASIGEFFKNLFEKIFSIFKK